MYNILICDDEKDIVSALKIYLETEGYIIFTAYNGREALDIIEKEEIHLALMDIMMPEMDGIHALELLRRNSNIPVLLLTAKSEDSDKVLGLNVGADDYITKPFSPTEVVARVRSHLRRYMQLGGGQAPDNEKRLTVGGIELCDLSKEVYVDGEKINLTPTEYEILKFLMQNAGVVYSPKEIYTSVWKNEPYGAEGTVAVHIRHLREKIEINPTEPRYLKVVWAKGYKIETGVKA